MSGGEEVGPRRVMPSSLDYEHLDTLASEIARRKNPQVWFDLTGVDTSTPEYRAGVQDLLNQQAALLGSGEVADWVENFLKSLDTPR